MLVAIITEISSNNNNNYKNMSSFWFTAFLSRGNVAHLVLCDGEHFDAILEFSWALNVISVINLGFFQKCSLHFQAFV